MRGKKVKASRRQLAQATQRLAHAVNENYKAATTLQQIASTYMWQNFWANVLIVALLTHFKRLEDAGHTPEYVLEELEKAVDCWPSGVKI